MKKIVLIALAIVAFAVQLFAEDGTSFYQKALENIKAENFKSAFDNLSKALALEPQNNLYKKEMAFVQYKRKANREAIILIEELINNGDKTAINYARLCELYTAAKLYAKAIEYAKTVNEKELKDVEKVSYYTELGNAYNAINFFPQAIEVWEKVDKLVPNNLQILDKLAKANVSLTKDAEALAYYRKAIAIDAKDKNRLFDAGIAAENCMKRTEAVDYFLKAKAAGYPDDVDFNYEIANVYYDGKDYKNAIIYLDKARASSPYDQGVASLTAYSYYYGGETKIAREVIEGMIQINPNNGDLYYLMGMTWQKDGNMDKAERYFDKAFKLKPALESLRVSKSELFGK